MSQRSNGWACDTSVAVAALDATHAAHAACRRDVVAFRPALAGHALFETYSVLTRLPVPLRVTPTRAAEVIESAFPEACSLEGAFAAGLVAALGRLDLAGGAVYDALVGYAALENNRTLLTRDLRAVRVYERIGVPFQSVE